MANIETWRPIENYHGIYEVSNMGRVRSLTRKISCHQIYHRTATGVILAQGGRSGYKTVMLSKDGSVRVVGVHRLVAQAFLKKDAHRNFVNHLNSCRDDNRVENLEWVTHAENMIHAQRSGRLKTPWAKKVIRDDGVIFASLASAARAIGSRTSHVWEHLRKKRKHVKSRTFTYLEEQ